MAAARIDFWCFLVVCISFLGQRCHWRSRCRARVECLLQLTPKRDEVNERAMNFTTVASRCTRVEAVFKLEVYEHCDRNEAVDGTT